MKVRLEHANLQVRDMNAMLRFVQTAFPDFELRRTGENLMGKRWLHVGTDDTYLALTEATEPPAEAWQPYGTKPGLNHLGYEVDDVESLRERMLEAKYRESTVPNAHPHRRRVYFYDPEGNDWEFVQYRSDDPRERNDYELED